MKKAYLKIAILMIVAIFMLPVMVNATEPAVAKIGETEYATLAEAIAAAPKDGTSATITLLKSVEDGTGFIVNEGQNIVIDFNNYTYDASNPLVGSEGTVSNGCQLLKGSTVTFKNGTLKSTAAAILIQNYSNLTLKDMTVDTTMGTASYSMSNNNGTINILGNTSIKANKVAFDMCWWPTGYPNGAQITVDTTGTITGNIELGTWGTIGDTEIKSTLNIKNIDLVGEIVTYFYDKADSDRAADMKEQVTITGGTFTQDVKDYVPAGYLSEKIYADQNIYEVKLNRPYVTQDSIKDEESSEHELLLVEEVQEQLMKMFEEEAKNNATIKAALENGDKVNINFEMDKVEEADIPETEAKAIKEVAKNGTIVKYYDITLAIFVNGKKEGNITDTTEKFTFKVAVEKELEKEGRTFFMYKYHGDKVEKLEMKKQEDGSYTFETDGFSTYALAYEDKVVENKVEEKVEEKDETPKTGVESYVSVVALVAMVSVLGIVVLKKRD